MPGRETSPALEHLYQLCRQIEADRGESVELLRRRDHAIGSECGSADAGDRLMFWLQQVAGAPGESARSWLNEKSAALLLRVIALGAGVLTMLGFLLASDRGLVNVSLFLLVFVLLQLLLALAAGVVMLRSVRGNPPAVFPLNPARFVIARALPDRRYLDEASGVLRLLALRYGQEAGAFFTLGAIGAFLLLTNVSTLTFVWGSTLGGDDNFITWTVRALSAPWASWLPGAVPSAELIAQTHYVPAQLDFSLASGEENRRGWWAFLLMGMLVYGLLPRLVLWLVSRLAYRRELDRSFVTYPGAEAVLARMNRPLVSTQAREAEGEEPATPLVEPDEGVMLLDWAGALGAQGEREFEELLCVLTDNRLAAGLGSPDEDKRSIAAISRYRPETLLVAVKAWEPPMADLADALAGVSGVPRCSLCLVPLPEREVTEHNLEEWQAFARELPFASVSARALHRV